MTDDLTRTEDLTDPKVLRAQCEEFAAGLDQQAIAASHRNAFQGHPQPAFFFGKIATILRSAAAYIALSDEGKPAKNADGTRGGSDPNVTTPPPNPSETKTDSKKK